MSQFNSPITVSDLNQADVGPGNVLGTGDLRRNYNFGEMVHELSPDVDSLFTIMNALRRKPTKDSQFKIKESRQALHKRYAYVTGFRSWSGTGSVPTTGYTTNSADISGIAVGTLDTYLALKMETDYKSAGNIQNIYGQSTGAIAVGDSGTLPIFFLPGQIIRVNVFDQAGGANSNYVGTDFFNARITSVETSGAVAYLGVIVTRAIAALSTDKYLTSFTDATNPVSTTYNVSIGLYSDSATNLETRRTYVTGTSFGEGTSYPDTWKTTPYSTRYGNTQIFKTSLEMTGTAKAVELDIVQNEWDRLWNEKVREHKYDMASAIYWSRLNTDADGAQQTQGIVDFVLSYGNVFSLTTSKNQDQFLDDMTNLVDPRYNNIKSMIFTCSSTYYNWLHKLGGYPLNNLKLGVTSGSTTPASHYTFDFASNGNLFGAPISTFNTLHGPMTVMRDVHLDGSPVKMMGISLNNIAWRPLIGNGDNRDTTVYPEVLSLRNGGVDKRVDQILTEAGVEITMPENHVAWL